MTIITSDRPHAVPHPRDHRHHRWPIKLNSNRTFRGQMSFQDGTLDFSIMAVAVDGAHTRSIHTTFDRETLNRRTNTKTKVVQEWLP